MCGIYGWNWSKRAGVPDAQRVAFGTSLGILNVERGDHAWGGFTPTGDVWRGLGPATGAPLPRFARLLTFAGHTRWATTGDKHDVANAHPFQHGTVTLAHNGVISNHAQLNKTHGRTCRVDSEHLALHLAEGKPISELEGYGAIEWLDMRLGPDLRLCRLDRGELSIYDVEAPHGQGCVWSSDEKHLTAALDAAGLIGSAYKVETGRVYFVRGGKLWRTDDRLEIGDYWPEVRCYRPTSKVMSEIAESAVGRWLARKEMAEGLGLTQIDDGLWVDEAGVPVEESELDSLIEEDEVFARGVSNVTET